MKNRLWLTSRGVGHHQRLNDFLGLIICQKNKNKNTCLVLSAEYEKNKIPTAASATPMPSYVIVIRQ